jgi:hypothetical protein
MHKRQLGERSSISILGVIKLLMGCSDCSGGEQLNLGASP